MVFPSGFSSTVRSALNCSDPYRDCLTRLKIAWPDVVLADIKCHGMTKSVKLIKVHRKDQSINKNAILASFVYFFNFPDRNLIILYKIT